MGFAAGIGGLGTIAGGAVGHGSIQAALQSLMSNPLWGSIFAQKGADFLEGILSPPTPYEKYTNRALEAQASIIPELRAQARGETSTATKAITRQVRREGTRAGQSFAQGARRSGLVGGAPGGTAPYRAELSRIESGAQEALLQRLGVNQTRAQELLYGGMSGSIDQATAQAQYRDAGRSAYTQQIGDWVRGTQGSADPRDLEMKKLLQEFIIKLAGG